MVEKIEEAVGYMGKIKIAYVHAAAPQDVDKLRALVENRLDCVETIIAELTPALGVHTGPGTAGLCFYPGMTLGLTPGLQTISTELIFHKITDAPCHSTRQGAILFLYFVARRASCFSG